MLGTPDAWVVFKAGVELIVLGLREGVPEILTPDELGVIKGFSPVFGFGLISTGVSRGGDCVRGISVLSLMIDLEFLEARTEGLELTQPPMI